MGRRGRCGGGRARRRYVVVTETHRVRISVYSVLVTGYTKFQDKYHNSHLVRLQQVESRVLTYYKRKIQIANKIESTDATGLFIVCRLATMRVIPR